MSSSSSCAARSEASCGDPPSRGGGRGRTPRQPPRARVGQVERFNPAVQASRPHLKAPRFIEAHRLAPIVPRGIDVDVILDLMIHDLDLALWLTRSRVIEVHAVGVPVLTPRIDIANARLTFASGCVAN